jgi:hypothetical protein
MNYYHEKKDNTILEKDTSQTIAKFEDVKELKQVMRNLNLGGGFDGNTPPFFMLPSVLHVKVKKNEEVY